MIEVRRQGGRFGFRRKLYWRLSFMLTALCLTFCVGFTLILLKSLRELTDQTLELENWSLATELATELAPYSEGTVDFAKFQEVLARFRRFSPGFNVLFLDRNGTRLAIDGVDQTRTTTLSVATLEAALQDSSPEPALRYLSYGRHKLVPFSVARLRIGEAPGYVVIFLRLSDFNPLTELLFQNAGAHFGLLALAIVIIASIGVGWTVYMSLTRQFYRLLDTVRFYKSGDFSKRVPPGADNELGELSSAVNEMAEQLTVNIAEIENRDRVRRDLMANVAHDLRSPAAGILALAEVLAYRQNKLSPEEFQRCVQGIVDSGESLTNLVNELFDLARFEAGEVKISRDACEVCTIVDAVAASFRARASKSGIDFAIVAESPSSEVLADKTLLVRVLDNLLGNALKFTAPGGRITLAAAAADSAIRFSVRDTGAGIPKELLEKIFERFSQGESKRTDLGLGLGLAIVAEILRLHQTSIKVTSEPGQGTEFAFSLPRLEVTPGAVAPAAP